MRATTLEAIVALGVSTIVLVMGPALRVGFAGVAH